jgi:DNA-binding NtrC family response regulator
MITGSRNATRAARQETRLMNTVAEGRKVEVLVVDDEPAITEWLDVLLSQRCYEVRQAGGVAAALTAVRLRAPHAVVTDLGMGDGGGEHLLAEIAAAYPDVVRVVYSASPLGSMNWMIDSGLAHAVVTKSADLGAVGHVLARLVPPNGAAAGAAAR